MIAVTDTEVFWRDAVIEEQNGKRGNEDMSRLRSVSQKMLKWILIGVAAAAAAVLATRIYYIEEMLAALLLFAVLFSCAAAALLILFMLDRAGSAMLKFFELHARHTLQHARGWSVFSEPRSRT